MSDDKNKAQNVEITLSGAEFKRKVLEALVAPTAMPMLAIWWDDQTQWGFALGNDLKQNKQVRKQVALMMFKIITDLKLFDEISKKAD